MCHLLCMDVHIASFKVIVTGSGCYEIHYIPSGYGRAVIDSQLYNLSPRTLYVTGPHVEHSQISEKENPLWEYCVYFYIPHSDELQENPASNTADIFSKNKFWFGKDSQNIEATMKQLFSEFEHKQIGYQHQVELLLQQLVIKLVRNYEKNKASSKQYALANLQETPSPSTLLSVPPMSATEKTLTILPFLKVAPTRRHTGNISSPFWIIWRFIPILISMGIWITLSAMGLPWTGIIPMKNIKISWMPFCFRFWKRERELS